MNHFETRGTGIFWLVGHARIFIGGGGGGGGGGPGHSYKKALKSFQRCFFLFIFF